MNFVESANSTMNVALYVLIGIVALSGIVFMVSFFMSMITEELTDQLIAWRALGASGLVGVVAFTAAVVVALSGTFALDSQRRELIAKTYGIELSVDEYEALQYPASEPTEDTTFGAVTLYETNSDGIQTVRDITLKWVDGKFKLYENESGSSVLTEVASQI